MGGNRNHGFMRGNSAGRNGVGMPEPFYCDACEKEHSASTERTGFSQFVGSPVLLCDKKYYPMKEAQFKSQTNRATAVAKLKSLKNTIGMEGAKGLKSRIDFIATVFIHGLKSELNSYQLYDEHNIGVRDFDTCFEMNDGDLVVHGLIKLAKKNYWLKANLKKELGVSAYASWVQIYDRIDTRIARIQTDDLVA